MKTLVIVNPAAGGGGALKRWRSVEGRLKMSAGEFETAFTERPGHASDICREALSAGCGWIIAVGGDGTINETINGFFDGSRPVSSDAFFSFVASGTGCDFARTFREERRDHAGRSPFSRETFLDIGRLRFTGHEGGEHERYFNNIASFGISGEVDRRVGRMRGKRFLGGALSFMLASLSALVSHSNKNVTIKVDGGPEQSSRVMLVIVANGQYAGGGMWFAPRARPDDGLFEVVVFSDMGKAQIVKNFAKIYKGAHLGEEGVSRFQARKIAARSDEEVLLDVDGEAPGRLPATFEIIPAAVRLRY